MSLSDLTEPPSSSSHETRRKPSFEWLLPVGLVLGFLGILAAVFWDRLLPATEVTTSPVITLRNEITDVADEASSDGDEPTRGSMLFQASGWIEPDPYPIWVSTLVNGVVDEVHVLEGATIEEGDLLATLIDEDARLDLQEATQRQRALEKRIEAHCARSDILQAETAAAEQRIEALSAQLAEVEDNAERLNRLSEGTVPEQQVVLARLAVQRQASTLDEARMELPRLDAELVQLQAEEEAMRANLEELITARDRAQLALDRTRIHAPVGGVVLHLDVAPGMKRMLNMDSPKSASILEVYNPEELQARIDVPLNEAAALSVGQSVELVSELLPDRSFEGTVTRIVGQADLQRNTLQAKVAIHNPDNRLRPDMLVRAKFFGVGEGTSEPVSGTSKRLALYVPQEAVMEDSWVWVVSAESTAEKRQLEFGEATRDEHRRVMSGLRSGEQVLMPPLPALAEGDRLRIHSNHGGPAQ